MQPGRYLVYADRRYSMLTLRELVGFLRSEDPRPKVWSARLSTGALGLPGCPSGNRGPLSPNEVVLALGEWGLARLIELEFIPCSMCKPEEQADFWSRLTEKKSSFAHGTKCRARFSDKRALPYDARRIRYEEIIPVLEAWPSRMYVPPNLNGREIEQLRTRIEDIGYRLPTVGWYDTSTPGNFREY